MRIANTKNEVLRFLRASKDAFEAQTAANKASNEGYTVTFALGINEPISSANPSLVKSYIESLIKAVGAFATNDMLVIDLNVVDQDGFEHRLIKETRSNYEASQKLEAPVPQEAAQGKGKAKPTRAK